MSEFPLINLYLSIVKNKSKLTLINDVFSTDKKIPALAKLFQLQKKVIYYFGYTYFLTDYFYTSIKFYCRFSTLIIFSTCAIY